MKRTHLALAVVALALFTGRSSGSMILWNPRAGLCDAVLKAAAYALGGALFAATQDVDKWRCGGSWVGAGLGDAMVPPTWLARRSFARQNDRFDRGPTAHREPATLLVASREARLNGLAVRCSRRGRGPQRVVFLRLTVWASPRVAARGVRS
jgi:hypothetical protein